MLVSPPVTELYTNTVPAPTKAWMVKLADQMNDSHSPPLSRLDFEPPPVDRVRQREMKLMLKAIRKGPVLDAQDRRELKTSPYALPQQTAAKA